MYFSSIKLLVFTRISVSPLIAALVLFVELGFLTPLITLGATLLSQLGAAIYAIINFLAVS